MRAGKHIADTERPLFRFARNTSPASLAYLASLHSPGPPHQLNFRIELDTGILSFRARDEPYAINYDAVCPRVNGAKGTPNICTGPISSRPRQRSPADAALRAPAEPRQLLATMVYETRPPGGNVLTEERLAYIAEVERKVRAVIRKIFLPPRGAPGLAQQHLVPSVGAVVHQGPGPARVPKHAVRARDVLMSFEGMIRRWFIELVDAGSGAANSTAGAEAVERRLEAVGFDPAQASAMAEALAAASRTPRRRTRRCR